MLSECQATTSTSWTLPSRKTQHLGEAWHSRAGHSTADSRVEVKELMKSIGFGYPGGPDRAANLELCLGPQLSDTSRGSCPGLATDAPLDACGNMRPVTSYSGGWKMKMQLCAAQLMNADVPGLDSRVFAYSAPSLAGSTLNLLFSTARPCRMAMNHECR